MKSDAPTKDVVAALRKAGCSVHYLTSRPGAGQAGMPDLLVGAAGRTLLIEVKAEKTGKLSPDQVRWHASWRGTPVIVVTSVASALTAVLF